MTTPSLRPDSDTVFINQAGDVERVSDVLRWDDNSQAWVINCRSTGYVPRYIYFEEGWFECDEAEALDPVDSSHIHELSIDP